MELERGFLKRTCLEISLQKVHGTLMNVDWIKWMYFGVNEFEVDVNDSIFSGNEQQKV